MGLQNQNDYKLKIFLFGVILTLLPFLLQFFFNLEVVIFAWVPTCCLILWMAIDRFFASEIENSQERQIAKTLALNSMYDISDLKGNIKFANQEFLAVSGYKQEELIGKSYKLLKSNIHPPEFYQNMINKLINAEIWSGDICFKSKNNEPFWARTEIIPIKKNGVVVEYLSIRQNITRKKQQEEIFQAMHELQKFSLDHFHQLHDISSFIISKLTELLTCEVGYIGKVIVDPFSKQLQIEALAMSPELRNGPMAEFIQMIESNRVKPTQLNAILKACADHREPIITNQIPGELYSSHLINKDKLKNHVGIPIFVDGHIYAFIGLLNRPNGFSTEQIEILNPFFEFIGQLFSNAEAHLEAHQLTQLLMKEKRNLEAFLSSINEVVFFFDENLNCLKDWRSSKFLEHFPAKKYDGTSIDEVLDSKFSARVIEKVKLCQKTGLPQFVEIEIDAQKQTWFNFKVRKMILNRQIAYMINVYDITIERKIRSELDQQKEKAEFSSRLASIGELAAGIAHEINNPLTIINGFTDNLLLKLRKGPLDQASVITGLEKIKNSTLRASSIVRSMQKLSRVNKGDEQIEINLKESIDEAISMANPRIKANDVKVEVELKQGCSLVLGKPGEILQILINLLHNSSDAISKNENRWIKVFTELEGDFVKLGIMDSGNGIPDEIVSKMMQPFFTTKGPGKGTGLGLSISFNIAKNNGGELYYDKTREHTTFILKLKKPQKAVQSDAA